MGSGSSSVSFVDYSPVNEDGVAGEKSHPLTELASVLKKAIDSLAQGLEDFLRLDANRLSAEHRGTFCDIKDDYDRYLANVQGFSSTLAFHAKNLIEFDESGAYNQQQRQALFSELERIRDDGRLAEAMKLAEELKNRIRTFLGILKTDLKYTSDLLRAKIISGAVMAAGCVAIIGSIFLAIFTFGIAAPVIPVAFGLASAGATAIFAGAKALKSVEEIDSSLQSIVAELEAMNQRIHEIKVKLEEECDALKNVVDNKGMFPGRNRELLGIATDLKEACKKLREKNNVY